MDSNSALGSLISFALLVTPKWCQDFTCTSGSNTILQKYQMEPTGDFIVLFKINTFQCLLLNSLLIKFLIHKTYMLKNRNQHQQCHKQASSSGLATSEGEMRIFLVVLKISNWKTFSPCLVEYASKSYKVTSVSTVDVMDVVDLVGLCIF